LFYYEIHEKQFNDSNNTWQTFEPESSFVTNVKVPEQKHLAGYDVVSFSGNTQAECSPLSCNGLANKLAVNSHCLFESFSAAMSHLENGAFKYCEPGPYRIVAVYSIDSNAIVSSKYKTT